MDYSSFILTCWSQTDFIHSEISNSWFTTIEEKLEKIFRRTGKRKEQVYEDAIIGVENNKKLWESLFMLN